MELQDFYYSNKSVQKTNRFRVTIFNNEGVFVPNIGKMPEIKGFHVLDVSVPNWEFKKETLKVGPFVHTFPVMDSDGFEFSITFEEDTEGTVSKFVDWCQRRIMYRDGLYFNPVYSKIQSIMIETYRDNGEYNYLTTFRNCYFLKSSEVKQDYSSNDSLKIEIIFASDIRFIDFNTGINTGVA